jgi:hypothetical protein
MGFNYTHNQINNSFWNTIVALYFYNVVVTCTTTDTLDGAFEPVFYTGERKRELNN